MMYPEIPGGLHFACPVCGAGRSDFYAARSFEGRSSTWVKCLNCGTLLISPPPGPDVLNDYYCHGYKDKKNPGSVSHAFRFGENNKATIFSEYRLSMADVGLSGESLRGRKILDYGCANGFFLDFCAGEGCEKKDLTGFDIAKDLQEEMAQKGYEVLRREGRNAFDMIFLWDLLEHIPDPVPLIDELNAWLRPGGTVVVQTPRVGHIALSLKDEWEHLLPVEHVVLYSRESLVLLFQNMGFRLVRAGSFGANAPAGRISQPYKGVYDRLAKITDNGSTQVACFEKI